MQNSPKAYKQFSYKNSAVTNVCCPICKSSIGKLLYTINADEAAQHFVLKEVDYERHDQLTQHIKSLWGQDTCDLISCHSCGFIFAYPYVGGDADFYTLAYQRSGYPSWKWEYQQTADKIAEIAASLPEEELKLIEIGAGDGAFLRKISPGLIAKKNILSLEFSAYGHQRILEYGIECKSEDVRSLSIAEIAGKFDILCLFQVLEHMDRLNELFERLNALSKTDSHLFISVPNAELIEFNESHGSLLDMPPNHIGRWNYQAFECIASQFGWLIKDYQKEPFNLKAILKQQIAYHYLRLSQCSSSLANRIERLKSENIRKPLRIFCACCYALCNISTLVQTLRNKNLGDSQWIHLVKSTK